MQYSLSICLQKGLTNSFTYQNNLQLTHALISISECESKLQRPARLFPTTSATLEKASLGRDLSLPCATQTRNRSRSTSVTHSNSFLRHNNRSEIWDPRTFRKKTRGYIRSSDLERGKKSRLPNRSAQTKRECQHGSKSDSRASPSFLQK